MGLGYVGLPLAVVFAEAGFSVTGIDPDAQKADSINKGLSYIPDVPAKTVAKLIRSGSLKATTDFAVLKELDAVSICVPTPLRQTGDPDMSFILSATEELGKYMHPAMVVVLELTTYPGTTREVLLPKLGDEKGLAVGEEWFLAFSPRAASTRDAKTIPPLIPPRWSAGSPRPARRLPQPGMGKPSSIFTESNAEAAEMAKLLENTFRMINIGLVNEMAIICERLGVDIWEVIDAAATKPFGYMKFTPGPGLGGHCIPIDPLYLSWKMKAYQYNARFIELASEINTNMPRYVVSRILDGMNSRGKPLKGSHCLVLGAAYKPDIDDLRESPALDVIGLLQQKGAQVSYHDPYIPKLKTHNGLEMRSVADLMEAVRTSDCIVIVTNHKGYDYPAILEAAKFIFDSRNALGDLGKNSPKVERL